MTLKEAASQYSVYLYYDSDDEGWVWSVECGF